MPPRRPPPPPLPPLTDESDDMQPTVVHPGAAQAAWLFETRAPAPPSPSHARGARPGPVEAHTPDLAPRTVEPPLGAMPAPAQRTRGGAAILALVIVLGLATGAALRFAYAAFVKRAPVALAEPRGIR